MRYCIVIALICLLASCKNQNFLKQKYTGYHVSTSEHNLSYKSEYTKRCADKTLSAERMERQKVKLPIHSKMESPALCNRSLNVSGKSTISAKPIQCSAEKIETRISTNKKVVNSYRRKGEWVFPIIILVSFILLALLFFIAGIVFLFSYPVLGISLISAVLLACLVLWLYTL